MHSAWCILLPASCIPLFKCGSKSLLRLFENWHAGCRHNHSPKMRAWVRYAFLKFYFSIYFHTSIGSFSPFPEFPLSHRYTYFEVMYTYTMLCLYTFLKAKGMKKITFKTEHSWLWTITNIATRLALWRIRFLRGLFTDFRPLMSRETFWLRWEMPDTGAKKVHFPGKIKGWVLL